MKRFAALRRRGADQYDVSRGAPDFSCFFICATECLIRAKTLSRLMAIVLRHCASVIFSMAHLRRPDSVIGHQDVQPSEALYRCRDQFLRRLRA